MERSLIAYAIIALLVLAAAGAIAYRIYYSRERTYQRRVTRERKAHDSRMARRAAEEP